MTRKGALGAFFQLKTSSYIFKQIMTYRKRPHKTFTSDPKETVSIMNNSLD